MCKPFRITWRAARVNRGYTLKKAAELSGKNIDTIMRYEKDSTDIPHSLMQSWLDLYDVPVDIIFCGLESDFNGKEKANNYED